MPFLDHVTIRGFKSIAAIEALELRAINVVIGPNGSGKSNFIEAFSFFSLKSNKDLEKSVTRAGGANRLLHFGTKRTPYMFFRVDSGERQVYELHLQATAQDGLGLNFETLGYSAFEKQGSVRTWTNAFEALQKANKEVEDWLDFWRVYHFHDTGFTSPMKRTGHLGDNAFFREDGANLAAYLYLLQERHPEEFGLITRAVQRVAPFFDGFILRPDLLAETKIRLEWRHVGTDDYFDISALSDGTLRFIALATLLLQPEDLRPSLILIDEPELGLHPYAIAMLAALIKQASVATQVIVSTQSPLLLDHFEPEDVLVAERVNGGTVLKRLAAPEIEEWLTDYSLGQLWEKNEIGGRPKAE